MTFSLLKMMPESVIKGIFFRLKKLLIWASLKFCHLIRHEWQLWENSQWLGKNIVRNKVKKELKESMDRCTGHWDITEIMLKTALNTIHSELITLDENIPLPELPRGAATIIALCFYSVAVYLGHGQLVDLCISCHHGINTGAFNWNIHQFFFDSIGSGSRMKMLLSSPNVLFSFISSLKCWHMIVLSAKKVKNWQKPEIWCKKSY